MNKHSVREYLTVFSLVILTSSGVRSEPQGRELTEEVFFQPLETVITAGRTEQSIERAPATVAVISADEIKASGAMTIPDLLSLVPGLDVMTINSSHSEVNARGLNQLLSNKMLVLIDGRSAYFDFFGGVIWQALPIVLDQVDRIEVVRSPSSALYGANAFSGVINIITKNPRQLHGSHLTIQGGENSTLYTSYMLGNRKGNTGYRLALGTRTMNSFQNRHQGTEDVALGNFLLEHRFADDIKLSVEGGLINGSIVQNVRIEDTKFDATTSYAKMNLSRGTFSLQAFWNRGDETGGAFFPPGDDVHILYNTFDLEAQHIANLGTKNTFIYGGSYRFNTIESNIIDRDHKQNLLAGYFQDEYRLAPEVSLFVGTRIDHHPLVGVNYSPRGSVIYAPAGHSTFRFSVGKAFRNPSFTDSYIKLPIPQGPLLVGKSNLESEKITTYEIGYTYFPSHYFRWEADIFAYKFKDYISTGTLQFDNGILVQSFVNLGSATAYGFELSADLVPAPWVKFSTNYSFQSLDNEYTVLKELEPPKNKANFKLFLSLPANMSAAFLVNYVDRSKWEVPTLTGTYELKEIAAHTRCDTRFGYFLEKDKLEMFVTAYNVLNSKHREYPLGVEIKRRATAGFSLSF